MGLCRTHGGAGCLPNATHVHLPGVQAREPGCVDLPCCHPPPPNSPNHSAPSTPSSSIIVAECLPRGMPTRKPGASCHAVPAPPAWRRPVSRRPAAIAGPVARNRAFGGQPLDRTALEARRQAAQRSGFSKRVQQAAAMRAPARGGRGGGFGGRGGAWGRCGRALHVPRALHRCGPALPRCMQQTERPTWPPVAVAACREPHAVHPLPPLLRSPFLVCRRWPRRLWWPWRWPGLQPSARGPSRA